MRERMSHEAFVASEFRGIVQVEVRSAGVEIEFFLDSGCDPLPVAMTASRAVVTLVDEVALGECEFHGYDGAEA